MSTTVYVIRHGQTEGNKENRYIGFTDIDVTPLGEEQAEITAEHLFKTVKFDAIYSSDLIRAYRTAMITAKKQGIKKVTKMKDLREFNGGDWEGMIYSDIMAQYPEEYEVWKNDFSAVCCPNGEKIEECYDRVYNALKKIVSENDGKTVAVFAHGVVIRCLVCRLSGKSLKEIESIPWSTNTSITIAKFDGDKEELLLVQNDDHLGEEMKTLFKD